MPQKPRKRKVKIEYPLVECDCGPPAPGYVICKHVLNEGATVHRILPATKKHLGDIMCENGCHCNIEETTDLICEHHAKTFKVGVMYSPISDVPISGDVL